MATTLDQKISRLEFVQKLKQLMEKKNLSLYDLSQISRTAPGTVSRWLNYQSSPPPIARKLIIKELEKLRKEE